MKNGHGWDTLLYLTNSITHIFLSRTSSLKNSNCILKLISLICTTTPLKDVGETLSPRFIRNMAVERSPAIHVWVKDSEMASLYRHLSTSDLALPSPVRNNTEINQVECCHFSLMCLVSQSDQYNKIKVPRLWQE